MNSVPQQSATSFPLYLIPIDPVEAPAVREMAARIWPQAYGEIISEAQIAYMLDWMYAADRIREEIGSGDVAYHWIVVAGEKVGFLAAGPVAAGSPCSLHKLYLLPHAQGCGYGTIALAELVGSLSTTGATCLVLRVNRHNTRAIALYRKAGFEIYDEDCLEIGDGFVMDDYLMRRPFNA